MSGKFSIFPSFSGIRSCWERDEAKKDWVSFFASSYKPLCGFLLVGLVVLLLAGCREKPDRLHMGAGPGLPLLLAKTLAERLAVNKEEASGIDISNPDVRTVGDCCAAVSQWALSSRELDMAIMCPDAARLLVEKNTDYVLAGPVLLDGDVLVRKPDAQQAVRRVGMAHQRSAQRRLILATLGQDVEIVEMLPAALSYALERGAVDAVVLDRLTATQSAMPLREVMRSNQGVTTSEQTTQVLVLHKRLTADPQAATLAVALAEAVTEANTRLKIIPALQPFNQGGAAGWTRILTKFVSPLDSP